MVFKTCVRKSHRRYVLFFQFCSLIVFPNILLDDANHIFPIKIGLQFIGAVIISPLRISPIFAGPTFVMSIFSLELVHDFVLASENLLKQCITVQHLLRVWRKNSNVHVIESSFKFNSLSSQSSISRKQIFETIQKTSWDSSTHNSLIFNCVKNVTVFVYLLYPPPV